VGSLAWNGRWVAAIVLGAVFATAVVVAKCAPSSLFESGERPGWRLLYSFCIAIALLVASIASFRLPNDSTEARVWEWIFGCIFLMGAIFFAYITFFWYRRWRARSSPPHMG